MSFRPPPPVGASTTRRGYGARHQRIRATLIEQYLRDGGYCSICAKPLTDPPRFLDLAHQPNSTDYAGLAHRRCNRATNVPPGSVDAEPRPFTDWGLGAS